MITIYVDVLLLQSLYVHYFLLRAAARLTHSRLSVPRCVAAALASSLFSLVILLPPLPFALQLLLKVGAAAVGVTIAFGVHRTLWPRQFLCFFLCSFCLAGLLLAVCSRTRQGFAAYSNCCCYLNFSLLHLILFTAAAYFLLWILQLICSRRHTVHRQYEVYIRLSSKTAVLPGLADTGNTLTDLFSGMPVIVCAMSSLEDLLSGTAVEALRGYRLLPCETITAQGLLPLFRADEICIRCCSTGKSRPVNAMIGIGGSQTKAIFHPKLVF